MKITRNGPDVALMVDTNCFWNTPEAIIDICRQFEPYDPCNSTAMRPVSMPKHTASAPDQCSRNSLP